ncbi:unnamed protein product [Sphagnum jensenii]|uniref:Uncharacterized protein n=1 Tax=Sphagnum jensenii TaxID=128206 RepID=A0ABP1BLF2_9BRYO
MVQAELGGRISRALQQMSNATFIDEKVLAECLKQISRALLQADEQFKMAMNMQNNIKKIVNLDDLTAGHNKRKIIQQIDEVVPMDQQSELMQKLTKGNFTLRIMYEQFQNIQNMGPLSQVMSMVPGFSQELMPKGCENKSHTKVKKFITMMDSMTNEVVATSSNKADSSAYTVPVTNELGTPV